MSSYGRNFDFRVPPVDGQRSSRYYLHGSTNIPIGAPVVSNGVTNTKQQQGVILATGATNKPLNGKGGIILFEYGPSAFAGDDPDLVTYSDKGLVVAGSAVQLISGDDVKVVFRNTVDSTFLHTRDYDGRVMVAGLGATPTVAVGDMLTPGTGTDVAGYWAETSTASEAWLVVTGVDSARGEVEARFTF